MPPTTSTYPTRSTLGLLSSAGLFLCAITIGCGSDIEVVPVSGQITQDGKPVADVHVSFQPTKKVENEPNVGRGSVGTTDTEGRYVLQTVAPEIDGAVPGNHIVRLSTVFEQVDSSDDAAILPEDPIAEKFRDGSLEFDVPAEGTDKADFDLGS